MEGNSADSNHVMATKQNTNSSDSERPVPLIVTTQSADSSPAENSAITSPTSSSNASKVQIVEPEERVSRSMLSPDPSQAKSTKKSKSPGRRRSRSRSKERSAVADDLSDEDAMDLDEMSDSDYSSSSSEDEDGETAQEIREKEKQQEKDEAKVLFDHSKKATLTKLVGRLKLNKDEESDDEASETVGWPHEGKKPTIEEYAAYKRRIVHPNTAFTQDGTIEDTPYTSDNEEMRDARRAANLELAVSSIYSNPATQRVVRTLVRGNLPDLSTVAEKLKSYIVAVDLSPESIHALEWAIGTVLRDGNILYVVSAIPEDEATHAASLEELRIKVVQNLTNTISIMLNRTRLQVYVLLEIIHCKSSRNTVCSIIEEVTPTMVILGSRGRSALKGVLLGSFSNDVVERSSVPVMVARRKLHKYKNRDLNVRLSNNLRVRAPRPLSKALAD